MAENRTIEELERTHSTYDNQVYDWEFYIRSYHGGSRYRNGSYLVQHPFESETNYARRKQIAYFYNYCRPIVDIFTSYLYKKLPERDYGSLTNDTLFDNFFWDCDLKGNTFDQFMRDSSRLASVYGMIGIVVDKPSTETITLAESIERDIRPYLSFITPDNILDWEFTRTDNGRPILDWVKIYENGKYRYWTREGWELWAVGKDDKGEKAMLLDEGEHTLGEVPLVLQYNIKTINDFIGISDIADIADINKNIYYLCSDAKEIIENTAFPMLAMPYQKTDEKVVGPKSIMQFDPEAPNGKPFWLEAPHSSLSEIREWVMQDVREIHRIAKMGGLQASEVSAQAKSGVALELEQQQLYVTLSEKGDNAEQAEVSILSLWAKWEGKEFDGTIDYPDEFNLRDLNMELDRAIKSTTMSIQSDTFKKERDKAAVRAVLPKVDEETLKQIDSEIDLGIETAIETPSLETELGITEQGAEDGEQTAD